MQFPNKYHSKTLGILSSDNIIGKVLLRKLLTLLYNKIKQIIIFDHGTRKQPLTTTKFYESIMEQDGFYKGIQLDKLKHDNKIVVINITPNKYPHSQKPDIKGTIDILFNCHIPEDITRNNIDTCLNSHIWRSKQICQYLSTTYKIQKTILISSLYSQNYGYVSESDSAINSQILGYHHTDNLTPGKLKQHLVDIFTNDYQIWQWSIVAMQNIFALETSTNVIQVVRIPLVGPTLYNFQGFLVNFNTLTSLIYQIGKKNINALQGNNNSIIDMIPADFLVHYMITIAVISLVQKQKISTPRQQKSSQTVNKNINTNTNTNVNSKIIVHNLSTSSRNPISLSLFIKYITQAWIEYSDADYQPINFKIQQKQWQKKAYILQQTLPSTIKSRLAHLFQIKSWKIQAQQSSINIHKKLQIIKKYRYFLEHEWISQSNKSIDYFNLLSSQFQQKFIFNVNFINWKTYAKLCCYGINKYLLGLEVQKFNPTTMDLLNLQKSTYFNDIVWALTEGKSISVQSPQQIKNYILSTKSVKEAITQLVDEQVKKLQQTPKSYQKIEQQYYKIADEICTQMFSQYSMNSIRGFAWFLHKIFRTIYQKVVVDKKSIIKFKNWDQKSNGSLILMPTHRSYIDFLILSYVFFGYGLKVPYIAAAQDFLNIIFINILLRRSGAFFIKRNEKRYKNLYKTIMQQYITKLLLDNQYLQFFIQGTRSRVGKMLQPKFGILSIICKNVLQGKISNAFIIPVTINYQKILEGTSFTYQIMGESKVKESLSRLIKAVDVLKENYGRIYIELCQPISVKEFFKKNMPKYAENSKTDNAYALTLRQLGYRIVYQLTDALVITPPAILASVILMDRIGISDDKLSEKARWLCQQITSRGIRVAHTQSDYSISISNTLVLMGDIINKSKKDMFQVQVSFNQNSFIQLFTLTYYRNTLTHIFFQEGIIVASIASFGYQDMINCKIPGQYLKISVLFLAKLLQNQYVIQDYLATNDKKYTQLLDKLVSKDLVQLKGQNTQNSNKNKILCGIKNPQSNLFLFYCSLIWPVVQSYWICVLYLFKIIKDKSVITITKLQSEIQWFGQSLFTERIILHLQAISMDTIKNATRSLKNMKIIAQNKQNGKNGIKVLVDQNTLKSLQKNIQKYLKSNYATTIKGKLGGRGSVTLDFPFLSKL